MCNGCNDDADCGEGRCVTLNGQSVCSADCETDADCPAATACFALPTSQGGVENICLNDTAGTAGVCPAEFVCGGEIVDPDPDPTPTDDCSICDMCETDSDCAEGVCLNFGDGGRCTFDCASDSCPGDSDCFEVSGRNVCLNPDAAAAGVCPASYECAEETGRTPPSAVVASASKGCGIGGPHAALWPAVFALLGRRRKSRR